MQPPDPAVPPRAPGKHSSFEFVAQAPVLKALSGAGRVLDLGCGRGDWSLALARRGTPVLAVDRWAGGLDWLHEHAQGLPVVALRADITAPLPVPDASIDGVLLALVLHHLAGNGRAPGVLAEIARVCARTACWRSSNSCRYHRRRGRRSRCVWRRARCWRWRRAADCTAGHRSPSPTTWGFTCFANPHERRRAAPG